MKESMIERVKSAMHRPQISIRSNITAVLRYEVVDCAGDEPIVLAAFHTDAEAHAAWRDIEADRMARAVIAAMREPTEGMVVAAREWSRVKYGRPVGSDGTTGCWQCQIDAALAEPEG